jgi:predicted nucleic acid-binding protein
LSRFVLDASVTVAWCFADETTAYTETVLEMLAAGGDALAPAIWPLEVANVLVMAERRKRITLAKTTNFLQLLAGFAVSLDAASAAQTFDKVLSLAREQGLSTYDAAYLELAIREGLPLATLDTDLKKAARAVGVRIAGV